MRRNPLHEVWDVPDLDKLTDDLFKDLIFLAETEERRNLILAPDYSEIYRWLHKVHSQDTPLEWSARRILSNQELNFSILPPWAAEFYNNKDQIIRLFKSYAAPDGHRKFLERSEVGQFLQHLKENRLTEFIRKQPQYWREFTDYLQWFSEKERDALWVDPVYKFNSSIAETDHDSIPELAEETRVDLANYYHLLLSQLERDRPSFVSRTGADRPRKKNKSNEYDALSAACARFFHTRPAAEEQKDYLVVFTGSPWPLKTFRSNPFDVGRGKLQFAVSVISLDCYLRLSKFYRGCPEIAAEYGTYLDFVKAGRRLFAQVKGVRQLPRTVAEGDYVSRQYIERMRFDLHFRIPSGLLDLTDWIDRVRYDPTQIDLSTDAAEQASDIRRIVTDQQLFRNKMKGVTTYLDGTQAEIESHKKEVNNRLDAIRRQFEIA